MPPSAASRFGRTNLLRYAATDLILKASICFPDLSCFLNHRGYLPRPPHIWEGWIPEFR